MKLTKEQAEKQGYNVDTTCYPWLGYKGPRFAPTETITVFMDEEVQLRQWIVDALIMLEEENIKEAKSMLNFILKENAKEQ